MKTHSPHSCSFTVLEMSVSGKCVRPVLEMGASKEDQRGVVRFLVAEGAGTRDKIKTPSNAIGRNHPFA